MDRRIQTIVVGVASISNQDPYTGPNDEDPVLAPAVEIARALGARLHVVHAFTLPDPILAACAPEFAESGYFRTGYAAELEERLRAQVARFPDAERIRCHAVEGAPAVRICEVARQVGAGLVIVGATRRGRLWQGILGTTAARVLRTADVPVLVIHRPFRAPVHRVLLATDLSPFGGSIHERGLDTVEALFGASASEYRAVHVVEFDPLLPPPLPRDLLERAAHQELVRFLQARAPRSAPVEPKVRTGDAAGEIVREASEWSTDLLVVGTQGRTELRTGVLGSTAASSLRHVSCNVLVVPAVPAAKPRTAEPAGAVRAELVSSGA